MVLAADENSKNILDSYQRARWLAASPFGVHGKLDNRPIPRNIVFYSVVRFRAQSEKLTFVFPDDFTRRTGQLPGINSSCFRGGVCFVCDRGHEGRGGRLLLIPSPGCH